MDVETTGSEAVGPQAVTVLGKVPKSALAFVLPHEHLAIDNSIHHVPFADLDPEARVSMNILGELRVRPHAVISNLVLDDDTAVLDDLARFRRLGGSTIVELTPRGMGRDPDRMARLARSSGLNIISGTGYYVEKGHGLLVAGHSTEELADTMVADLTGPMPSAGVIGEIGISAVPHPDEWRVMDGAMGAQRRTGAPIWIHQTTTAPMASIIERVRAADVDPSGIVLCHVDYDLRDVALHRDALVVGLNIEMDLFGFPAWNRRNFVHYPDDTLRVQRLLELSDAGFESQLLISQDICMKTQLSRYGGYGYGHLIANVRELFLSLGGSPESWDRITRDNPARLLAWA